MTWFPIPRLGLIGQELDLPVQVTDIDPEEDNIMAEARNLVGAASRSYIRHNVPTITVSVARVPDQITSLLRGLQSSLSALNFIFNKTLQVLYLMATSATTTSIVIPPTSATGIVILGVYLQSDTLKTGTNYYSGGSTFDATTGTITLASALPGANTDVWVDYSFTGYSCFIKAKLKPHQGLYSGYWQGSIELTGA